MSQLFQKRALLACLVFLCVCGECHAGVDLFLKLTDIAGESLDSQHSSDIDVLAWSWGGSSTFTTRSGAGAVTSSSSFLDLTLTKYTDRSTPRLMNALSKGNHIPRATLYVRKQGLKPIEFYKIVCEEVLVTGLYLGGTTNDSRLTETVSLNFALIGIEYVRIDTTGVIKDTTRFSWNSVENIEASIPFGEPVDTDGDGLPDLWEKLYGTNPNQRDANGDLDLDGATNLEEYIAGTDPSKANSVFVAKMSPPDATGGIATLSWQSVPGVAYSVSFSASVEGPFQFYRNVPSAGAGTTSIPVGTDLLRRFFRVQVLP